ncbi:MULTISPECIES: macro domain-containing protein [unclassified Streptomyces]|uniref:macro domain-containing protein n=1 Tax=unclassified Streptomyces TaxID=2593676 RepID=UPI00386BEC90|nr:macro domain-containing protein [Streptomyces sp. NBC_00827]
MLDALLAGERLARDTIDAAALPTVRDALPRTTYRAAGRTVLRQGDLTALDTDAIVNAANSALLGCFAPMHPCIDNALHSAAGPRLRADWHTITSLQGHPEPTGTAKITRGYHCPPATYCTPSARSSTAPCSHGTSRRPPPAPP